MPQNIRLIVKYIVVAIIVVANHTAIVMELIIKFLKKYSS